MSNVTGPDTALDRDRIFERLVDQYQESVLRMCYYCLNDKSQAEDAAQETFLKLYRTLNQFRGDCGEKTWIMKIAIRVCYDMNHSGWFRFMNRSVTPEMLPGEAVTEEEKNDAEFANPQAYITSVTFIPWLASNCAAFLRRMLRIKS